MRGICVALAVCLSLVSQADGLQPIIVPFVTDPSPVIDGDLGEWANRGALREINASEQVVWGKAAWQGVEDLSGWVRFGYDSQRLYMACHVKDSFFSQPESGVNIWKGDHVMGMVDFVRSGSKADVVQFGLSPGNLKSPDDPGLEIKPEFVIWEPPGSSPVGAVVAARRTRDGYDIEAGIPWKLFKVKPVKYQTFALEMAISDCDQTMPQQETCMSINTARWAVNNPKRLINAGLADRAGHFRDNAFKESVLLAAEIVIKPGTLRELRVNVDEIPDGRVPTLTFKARLNRARAGGCAGVLFTQVNGRTLQKRNIANRPPIMQFLDGRYQPAWYRTGIVLYNSPDFEVIEKTTYKPVDCKACDFTLRLDGLMKKGDNTISFKNNVTGKQRDIVMADVTFSWSPPSRFRPHKVYAPAPAGPLPTYEPWTKHRVEYEVTTLPGGALRVSWNGRETIIASRFSRPGSGWGQWTADKAEGWDAFEALPAGPFQLRSKLAALTVHQTIVRHPECVVVRQLLVNESKRDLPVMISHRAEAKDVQELWLSGRPMPTRAGATVVCENPSVVVLGRDAGFGLMAHDDVFRVHCRSSRDKSGTELADNNLVLRPGTRYAHEWLIFPLPRPDYWHFVNAARRFFNTNFTIEGSFAFVLIRRDDCALLPWEVLTFLDRKSVRFASVSLNAYYKGVFPHGPVKRLCEPTRARVVNTIIRAHRPRVKVLTYFNCFDCARRANEPVRWPACRVLRPDGGQAFNGPTYPLYFPTLTNAYGKEMDRNVDWLLDVVGADGLYWDCSWSSNALTHYGEPWDGWSADIDPRKHTIVRKKSNLALLTWPWRKKTIERLMREGRPIVTNRNPATTSAMKYHFPRFVETADISALSRTHLFTPIALGDHITERNQVDSYRWMLNALDWGGLYYWYSSRIIPKWPTLTSRMFPFTPIELHSGYVVGKERILTKKSGLFGWGDMCEFEAYVFDRVGKETDKVEVKRVVKDGKAYAEVRIPEGYSVAIVRKLP